MILDDATITKDHYEEAKEMAKEYLAQLGDNLYYHRKGHTLKGVVPAVFKLAKKEGFSQEATYITAIAALFHDVGFIKQYKDNEIFGAHLAERYMRESRFVYTREQMLLMKDAILSTNLNSTPSTKVAKLLRDADLCSIGHAGFFEWMSDLQKEAKIHPECHLHEVAQNWDEWVRFEIKFLEEDHDWFTNAAKELFEEQKQKNIAKLKQMEKEL